MRKKRTRGAPGQHFSIHCIRSDDKHANDEDDSLKVIRNSSNDHIPSAKDDLENCEEA